MKVNVVEKPIEILFILNKGMADSRKWSRRRQGRKIFRLDYPTK